MPARVNVPQAAMALFPPLLLLLELLGEHDALLGEVVERLLVAGGVQHEHGVGHLDEGLARRPLGGRANNVTQEELLLPHGQAALLHAAQPTDERDRVLAQPLVLHGLRHGRRAGAEQVRAVLVATSERGDGALLGGYLIELVRNASLHLVGHDLRELVGVAGPVIVVIVEALAIDRDDARAIVTAEALPLQFLRDMNWDW
mmetsp:Transcript_21879/g.67138  ORF Transcript_21879/g.67138 Transcript_21879/m.67138 type:complete len:201 (-) Transcript_21879:268-870(-)